MNIEILDKSATEKMRVAGRLAAQVLQMIEEHVQPGVSTEELDRICHRYITEDQQAIPAPLDYHGFPKSICTSINHQVCHGIPGPRKLREGDLLNIDVTVIKDGYHGDTSKMFIVTRNQRDRRHIEKKKIIDVCYECTWLGIEQVKPNAYLGDIGHAIATHAEKHGYSVVKDYCGHGIGRQFHAEPQVLHFGQPKTGAQLETGMAFTIEPMINAGGEYVQTLDDGWTVITVDHSLSVQWEHTILVTPTGYEVLTLRDQESPRLS